MGGWGGVGWGGRGAGGRGGVEKVGCRGSSFVTSLAFNKKTLGREGVRGEGVLRVKNSLQNV